MTQQRLSIEQAMVLAAQHATAGNHAVARKLYGQILNARPDNENARRALEELPPEEGAATPSFNADMQKFSEIFSSGDTERSLEEVQRLCDLYTDQPLPLNIKGAILLELSRYGEAQDAIKASIDLTPGNADIWVNLGSAQIGSGELEEAVLSFQQALKLGQAPGQILAANRGLGKALGKLGNFSAARQAFERALSLQPSDIDTRLAYAGTLSEAVSNEAALTELLKVVNSDPSSALAYLELGYTQMKVKDFEAARTNMEKSLELAPDHPRVHHRLGQLYAKIGKRDLSARSFRRSLELEPGSAEVQHLLDVVEGNHSKIAPAKYVEDLFDDYAAKFERSLVEGLGYRTPELFMEMITQAEVPFDSVLDLGCGTGLMGPLLRGSVDRLDGVDLSERMLAKAREKGIYDNLKKGDILDADRLFDDTYGLVVSSDVLVYFGDLDSFMDTASKKMNPGSLLCVSTELLEEECDYQLLDSGRYSHAKHYVTQVAEKVGLKLLEFREAPLRKEDDEWLIGGFYLFSLN